MKKSPELDPLAPRPNLDFRKGVRGKHSQQSVQGASIAIIDPDLAAAYPDSKAVNEALRVLSELKSRLDAMTSDRADRAA